MRMEEVYIYFSPKAWKHLEPMCVHWSAIEGEEKERHMTKNFQCRIFGALQCFMLGKISAAPTHLDV